MSEEAPTGWTTGALGDLCEINPKHSKEISDQTQVTFVPMAAVDDERGEILERAIRSYGELRKGYTHFAENDVIFAKITPCMQNGKAAVARDLKNGLACGSTEFFVFRTNQALLPKYLYSYIRQPSFRDAAAAVMTGVVGQARVPRDYLEKVDLPLPPPNEQRRIVAKIETLNEKSTRAKQALDAVPPLLEKLRQSILAAAFRGYLTKDWRAKNPNVEPASQLLEKIRKERRARWEVATLAKLKAQGKTPSDERWKQKYEEPEPVDTEGLPELPEGWVWANLEHLTLIAGGVTKGQKRKPEQEVLNVPYLRVANVQRGFLNLREVSEIEATKEEVAALQLRDGDILLNEGGDLDKLGRGWVWHAEIPLCIHQNHVFRARPVSSDLVPEYISHYTNTFGQQYFLDTGKQTTNLASVSMSRVRRCPVPVAPASEIQEIARRVNELLGVVDRLGQGAEPLSETLATLNSAVLAKAFRGELVPQDPNDEPASVLLERIRRERGSTALTPRGKGRESAVGNGTLKAVRGRRVKNGAGRRKAAE